MPETILETVTDRAGSFLTTHWSVVLSAREQVTPAAPFILQKVERNFQLVQNAQSADYAVQWCEPYILEDNIKIGCAANKEKGFRFMAY